MTTRPKTKRFRIKRAGPTDGTDPKAGRDAAAKTGDASNKPGVDAQSAIPGPVGDGFGDKPFATAKKPTKDEVARIKEEIEAIKAEGLTGRHLRIA